MQATEATLCPRIHQSTEADYCSECGARLAGGAPGVAGSGLDGLGKSRPGSVCPDCKASHDHAESKYCEVCGYNFSTGARGEIPLSAEQEALVSLAPGRPEDPEEVATRVAPAPESETTVSKRWKVLIVADSAPRGKGDPEDGQDPGPVEVPISLPVTLIGRGDASKGIVPEVALPHDEAVSRRHALLLVDAVTATLQLRDIGSANGTVLNGEQLPPMVDHELKSGDEITLGQWSRLRIGQA